MARLAIRFAMASPRITALSIEAQSFPEHAMRAQVRAVPHTVINGVQALIGAVPESALIKTIQQALSDK
jgi:predicted DsbA family dithiol-disulfide isomerase